MKCILCGGKSELFFSDPRTAHDYFHCTVCDLRFLDPRRRLSVSEESTRYRQHNNDVFDPRYQEFMRPMVELIQQNSAKEVLDFGCGDGPVLRHVLEPLGVQVALYDPYFYPDTEPLERRYDFVAAVEVCEHLYDPAAEFPHFLKLLKPGGRLGVMTLLVTAEVDFGGWFYRKDPTHVTFYSRETFGWIRKTFGFSDLRILSDRLIELRA